MKEPEWSRILDFCRRIAEVEKEFGFEINHHAEFIGLLKDKKTRKVIAYLYEDGEPVRPDELR